MDIKGKLELQVSMLDITIREKKQDLIDRLNSLEQILAHNRMRLENTLDDSRLCHIEPTGIIQRQGQMIESLCMEIATNVRHYTDLGRIIIDSEGE